MVSAAARGAPGGPNVGEGTRRAVLVMNMRTS